MDINKESDKNVANEKVTHNKNKYIYIKEVAERIRNEYREKYKDEKFLPEPSEQTCMAYEILNLLAEREQDKKRIKELEEENTQLEAIKNEAIKRYNFESIPVQKVKDKIEEVHNMKFKDERLNSATIDFAVYKFKELLEEK